MIDIFVVVLFFCSTMLIYLFSKNLIATLFTPSQGLHLLSNMIPIYSLIVLAIGKMFARSCRAISPVWLLGFQMFVSYFLLFLVVATKISLTMRLNRIIFQVGEWVMGVRIRIVSNLHILQVFEIRSTWGSTSIVFIYLCSNKANQICYFFFIAMDSLWIYQKQQ